MELDSRITQHQSDRTDTSPALPGATRSSLLLAGLFHSARLAGLDIQPALQTFQPGNLIALFGDGLLQGRNFAKQLQHKCFQIEIRQIIEGMSGWLDHRSIETEIARLVNPTPTR